MRPNRTAAGAILVLLATATLARPALASCQSPRHVFDSGYFSSSTGSSLSTDFTGVWWQVGYGDQAVGAGSDSGSFPPGEPSYYGSPDACYYAQGCWLFADPDIGWGYFMFMSGDWTDPRVDGCVDTVPGTACMAAALSDQRYGAGFFTLITDAENSLGNFDLRSNTSIRLAAIPKPVPVSVTDVGGILTVDLAAIRAPVSGLLQDPDPACAVALDGFTLYQKTVPPGAQPPVDRRREGSGTSPGWQLAHGGAAAVGPGAGPVVPHPDGAAVRLTPLGCVDGGSLVLATSLEFDSGFRLRHLSANSTLIPCGTCTVVDTDGDGARTDKCTTDANFDCDPAQPEVYPGAPQICDGLNNDCNHPNWPSLDGTNEADADGDGVTDCAGDTCPHDPLNDADQDGVCGDADNCQVLANPGQEDRDDDGQGDLCDPCPDSIHDDRDADGLCGNLDNCPVLFNPEQQDADSDGIGDACDACVLDPENDFDHDGRCGDVDTCPHDKFNDADRDQMCGDVDPCPRDAENDFDADGRCGDVDNCPHDINLGQDDTDHDGQGDQCDLFARPLTVGTTFNVQSLAAGDLDGDGDADVVAAWDQSVFWYENISGMATTWTRRAVGSVKRKIAPQFGVADLNGDGALDIWHIGDEASWFRNTGSFTKLPILSTVCSTDAESGDLDGDGDVDLVIADDCADAVVLIENVAGDGSLWIPRTLATSGGLTRLAAGDADSDGDIDLFVAGSLLQLLLNDGAAASFTPVLVSGDPGDQGTRDLEAADMNNDGRMDLLSTVPLSAQEFKEHLQWFENPGDGSPWPRHQFRTVFANDGFYSIRAADVDGDGDQDAVTLGKITLSWEENRDGNGQLLENRIIKQVIGSPSSLAVADLDGDEDPDVLALEWFTDDIEHYRNIGRPQPVASAGPDQRVECSSTAGARVILDGSGSSQPGGQALTYRWTGPFPDIVTPDQTVEVEIPPGIYTVELTVVDPYGEDAHDSLVVSVVEPAGPGAVTLSPSLLWPPNHRLVEVSAGFTDTCGVGLSLVSAVSSEPDDAPGGGDGKTTGDVAAAAGTPATNLRLRAERSAGGPGRVYTLTWEADDLQGGRRAFTGSASVPLHPDETADPIELSVHETAAGTLLTWTASPDGTALYNTIRGNVGGLSVQPQDGGRVETGPVTCLRSRFAGAGTAGWEDAAVPSPGQAWFYLVESLDPVTGEPSAYGSASGLLPIVVTSGGCEAGAP